MKINSFSSAFPRQRKFSEILIYATIPLKTIQGRNFNEFSILLGETEPFTTLSSSKIANLLSFFRNALKFLQLKFFTASSDDCF